MKYKDLLQRYISMERLTFPPHKEERTVSFTSYDRRSVYDPEKDCYIDWGANNDGDGYIRKNKDGSIVALEIHGSGAVIRTWSALPQQGAIRIWIDDGAEPIINVPFVDFFDRYPGDIPPMNLTSLVFMASRGRNNWLPIPFHKYIRVELAPGWGSYYQFTCALFPVGANDSFPEYADQFLPENQRFTAHTDRILYSRLKYQDLDSSLCRREMIEIPPHGSADLSSRFTAGILRKIVFTEELPTENIRMRIFWDGDSVPSVDVDLSDFLGRGVAGTPMGTMACGFDRFYSYSNWYMPFSNGYKIIFFNDSDSCVRLTPVLCEEERGIAEMSSRLRFHAKTHSGYLKGLDPERFLPSGDRWPDWPVWQTGGQGRFCGMYLRILNSWKEPESLPESWFNGKWDQKNVDWWWGEGDEKFFVNGEKFPSSFGTGSEDYIGYAWAAEPPFPVFDSPFAMMDMPISGNGITSAARYHIPDDIPFQDGFEAFIEKYKPDFWENEGKCLYRVTAFCYMQACSDDGYPLYTGK